MDPDAVTQVPGTSDDWEEATEDYKKTAHILPCVPTPAWLRLQFSLTRCVPSMSTNRLLPAPETLVLIQK